MKKTKERIESKKVKSESHGKLEVVAWVIVVLLVACGVVVTVGDYQVWRHTETDNFGQGWGDLDRPALPLPVTHRLTSPEIRIKLPEGWKFEETGSLGKTEKGFREVATVGEYVTIMTTKMPGNLVDLVDARAAELSLLDVLMKDRAYIGGNKLDLTVLEWTEELPGGRLIVRQEVWGKLGDEVVKIETVVDESEWSGLKKTVWSIYENVEMIY